MQNIFVSSNNFMSLKKEFVFDRAIAGFFARFLLHLFALFSQNREAGSFSFAKSGGRLIWFREIGRPSDSSGSLCFFLQSELDAFAEHLLDLLFQYRMLRCRERRIPFNDLFRREAHFFEDIRIFDQIADVQLRQAVLSCTEELAGAAQFQVFFGNDETVCRAA